MPPPAPRKRGNGPLIALLVGGGLVAVLIVAVVAVVLVSSGGMTPEEKLRAAADDLSADAAVGLEGDFGGGANAIRGELSITKGGRAYGAVTWNNSEVTVLAADGMLFAKAGSAFWKQQISGSETPYYLEDGEQWGRLNADELDLKFKEELSPAALAAKLDSAAGGTVDPVETSWKGTKALKFSTFASTLYISDSDDPELLHYEATTPRVALDVNTKSASQSGTIVSNMRTSMGELKDSFNASARPTIAEWKKGNCQDDSGCTVQAQIRPPYGVGTPVSVEIQFALTAGSLTGKDLGKCSTTITIKTESPVWASCRVKSSAWTSWAEKTGGTFYKHADYKVIGATASEVQAMQSGLDSE
ncbi:hypothetical protein [Actinomadura algeriensis]|uniref:Uncharacterized protein n=1 Tax=Actinomadura algeriensis TaxID=1679523 RepID=A0ABR9JM44_9ACTN|nr:hypothetical protein [Actinomadura algeriensis]MBE1531622.1 hypothetical protein [Actinomadura algeriensis]